MLPKNHQRMLLHSWNEFSGRVREQTLRNSLSNVNFWTTPLDYRNAGRFLSICNCQNGVQQYLIPSPMNSSDGCIEPRWTPGSKGSQLGFSVTILLIKFTLSLIVERAISGGNGRPT